MRLANELPVLHERGADAVGLCVDSPGRNAAFARRWHLRFPIASDPGGEGWLRPLDLWNPEERGGIGVPSVTLVLPDGEWARRRERQNGQPQVEGGIPRS